MKKIAWYARCFLTSSFFCATAFAAVIIMQPPNWELYAVLTEYYAAVEPPFRRALSRYHGADCGTFTAETEPAAISPREFVRRDTGPCQMRLLKTFSLSHGIGSIN